MLSEAQRRALTRLPDTGGGIHAYQFNESTLRALQRRGLAEPSSDNRSYGGWFAFWRRTPAGRAALQENSHEN